MWCSTLCSTLEGAARCWWRASPGPSGPLIVPEIPPLRDATARAYVTPNRDARFGMTLAQVTADRDTQLGPFRTLLAPLRQVVAGQDYVGGDEPDYADYAVFGAFRRDLAWYGRTRDPSPICE